MYFLYFVIIFYWKRPWTFIWTNLNSFHLRMFYAKFKWHIGPLVLEKILKIVLMNFRYFVIVSPKKRARPFILTFKQTWTNPWPKDVLCQILLKLAEWFWIRRLLHFVSSWEEHLNFVSIFSLFRNYLPLEKIDSLPPKHALCQVWLKLAQ